MKVKVFDIDWDTDGEDVELPLEIELEIDDKFVNDEDELSEVICDYLSDEYGFCHFGFDYFIQGRNTI